MRFAMPHEGQLLFKDLFVLGRLKDVRRYQTGIRDKGSPSSFRPDSIPVGSQDGDRQQILQIGFRFHRDIPPAFRRQVPRYRRVRSVIVLPECARVLKDGAPDCGQSA